MLYNYYNWQTWCPCSCSSCSKTIIILTHCPCICVFCFLFSLSFSLFYRPFSSRWFVARYTRGLLPFHITHPSYKWTWCTSLLFGCGKWTWYWSSCHSIECGGYVYRCRKIMIFFFSLFFVFIYYLSNFLHWCFLIPSLIYWCLILY